VLEINQKNSKQGNDSSISNSYDSMAKSETPILNEKRQKNISKSIENTILLEAHVLLSHPETSKIINIILLAILYPL